MRLRRPAAWLFMCSGLLAPAQVKKTSDAKEFFSNPEFLCSALRKNGVQTGSWQPIGAGFAASGMRYDYPSPFVCEYPEWTHPAPPIAGAPAVPGPDVSMIYRVSGDTGERADIVTIAVTVYRPEAMADGRQKLKRNIEMLFEAIGRSLPAGLLASIDRSQHYRFLQPYGLVSFALIVPERPLDRRPGQKVLQFRLWDSR
jgi:hypothetical protein